MVTKETNGWKDVELHVPLPILGHARVGATMGVRGLMSPGGKACREGVEFGRLRYLLLFRFASLMTG